jgi:CheY-like chemotaxis protein
MNFYPPHPSSTTAVLKHLQVLLVEDEPDIADLFTFILEAGGAKVVLAVSAQEGLDQLLRFQPDILICNLRLPDHDGVWLLHQLRSQGLSQQRLPAIAVTSFTREVLSQDALAAGFQSFLAKPLDPDDLVEAVLQVTAG